MQDGPSGPSGILGGPEGPSYNRLRMTKMADETALLDALKQVVDPEAQKTDGYQRNDSLLLSPDCRADAIPGLEIEADDVRCTHGATAGRVDAEQIFYCMCRGLSRYEAMHMIVEGFFHGVYDRIAVEAVRETLSHAVKRKLGIDR